MAMKKNYIGIREARINLSKLIRDVRGGMEIIITDRGMPVARLIPAEGSSLSLEDRIKNYEYCGLIEPCSQNNKVGSPVEIPSGNSDRDGIEESSDD
jgi:prevent-host-death family protein